MYILYLCIFLKLQDYKIPNRSQVASRVTFENQNQNHLFYKDASAQCLAPSVCIVYRTIVAANSSHEFVEQSCLFWYIDNYWLTIGCFKKY